MDFKELIIVVIYFAVSNGGPTSRTESCATICPKNEKFNYVIGNTYIYDYTAQTETKIAGSSKDLTQLQMRTRVHITAVSPCNMELKLHHINVVQTNSKNAKALNPAKLANFKAELEAHPTMFAFSDGTIDHVCPQSGDSAWSVNFKRGFLTVLQNSMKSLNKNEMLEEIDVSGQCLTKYSIRKRSWSSTFITKTKDLDSCVKRSEAGNIGMQFAPHFSNLASKPLPILKSEAKCEQVIDTEKHILQSAKCTEIHVLKPFSNGAAGVVTTTKQEVNFIEKKSATRNKIMPQTVRSSMLFDHQKKSGKLNGNIEEVKTILRDMCASQTVTLHTPTLFKSLVVKMRQLEESQLFSVYNDINRLCPGNEVLAKKFFLDALHMTVTPASAALIIRLIQSDHISSEMKDSWLLTLAFIPSPTKAFVMKFAVLLDEKNLRKNRLLGLSALVHTYCHQPSIECSNDMDLQIFAEKFANNLKGCQDEKNTTEKVLIALKAIGNVGFLTKAEKKLKSCYLNSKNDVAVRVAAIDALRRWPCDTQHKSLFNILSDHEEDVEVRLTSYLSLMRCPSRETLESVRRMLETEQINQVGSFIWTHLINLQKTSISFNNEIKSIVQSFVLRQKFSTEALKFSRAYEKSFYSEAYKTGLHGQANVMFTSKSYLPRSLTTNLTVELFGHAVNLIEIGGRMEGFEEYFESFFGSNGYFPEKTVQDALMNLRGKRDVNEHLNELHDQSISRAKKLDHVLSWLLKEEETSITESFTFVDTSLIIPTQIGLPLNLTLNGTAIVQLLMKGHTHIRQIFNLDCDVTGYIKPSAAIQITGSMSVNTPDLEVGVRLDATLHTSTSISGKLVLNGGRLVNVQIDAPEDRKDVINIDSQLFIMEGDDTSSAKPEFLVKRFDFAGCSGLMTRTILGLDICAEISYPNASEMANAPGFPLTGPTSFAIYIEKSDHQLTSYDFNYQWEDNEVGDQFVRTKKIYLDTPGSSTDRQFLAELVLDEPGQTIKASLRTPFKKFGLQGKLVNEKDEKRLDGTITMDDVEKIVLQAELIREEYDNTQRYSPRLHLQLPYLKPIDLKGYVTIQNGVKIALDMSLENLTIRPITVIGDISIANDLYNVDLTFKSFLITTNVKANFQTGEKQVTGNVNTDFSLLERWNRRYGLTFKYRDESSSAIKKLLASGEIQGSEFEPLGIAWELHRRKNYIENQLDFKANKKIFATKQTFTYGRDSSYNDKYTATLTAKCSSTNFDWTIAAVHQRNYASMTSSIEAYRGKTVVGKIQANAHAHLFPLMNLGLELSLQIADYDVIAAANVKRLNTNEYEGKVYIQLDPGEKAQILARYQDYSTSENRRHAIKIDATSPWSASFLLESELDTKNGGFSTNNVLNVNDNKYVLMVDYDPKSEDGHQLKTAALIAGNSYGGDASYRSEQGTTAIRVDVKRFGFNPITAKLEFTFNSNDIMGDVRVIFKPDDEIGVRVEFNKLQHGFRIGVKTDGMDGTHEANFETNTEGDITGSSFRHGSTGNLITNNKEYKSEFKLESTKNNGVFDSSVYMELRIVDHAYKLEGNYKSNGNSWVGSGHFQNDQNEIFQVRTSGTISIWEHPEFDFNGILEMESSAEKYHFGINHVNTKEQFLSSIQVPSMWRFKPFNFSIQGLHKRNTNDVQYSGGSSLRIENGNSYSIHGTSKVTGRVQFMTVQFGENNKYITLQVDTESDDVGKTSQHLVSILFTSPFKNFENLKVSMRNELGKTQFASNMNASWSPKDTLYAEAVVSWKLDNEGFDMALAGKLQTPFNTRNLSIAVNHEWRKNRLNDSLVIKRNDENIASFIMEGFFPSINNLDMKVKVMLPKLPEISSGFSYAILDKQLHAALQFVYGKEEMNGELKGEKKYSMDLLAKIENSKKLITLAVTTPSGTYGPYQGEYTWSNIDGIQELTFGLEYAPARKLAIGASSDVGQYKGKIHLDIYTPFDDLNKISASITYNLFEPTRISVQVEWDGANKIEINLIGHLSSRNADIQISALTSFDGYENITTGLKYDIRPTIRKKILLMHVSVKDQLFKMQGTAVNNNAVGEMDVQIGTPYEDWKVIGGKVKVNPTRDGHSVRLQLKRNEKKLEAALVLRPNRIVARLRTPFEIFRSILIEWKMDKGDDNLMTSFVLKKDSFTFDASAMYKLTRKEDRIVEANVNMPSIDVSLGIIGNAYLSDKKIEGTVELKHNNNKMKVTGHFLNEVKQKDLLLIFSSPLRGFEDIKLSASYINKDPFHHVATFNIEQSSKTVQLIARLIHENNANLASLALTSDYPTIPSFIVAAEQDKSTPTKTASFTLNLGERHLKLLATSTTEYTRREGSLSFASNFGETEKELSGFYSYDLGRPQKVVTLQFAKDGRAIDVKGTYELNTQDHPASLVVSIEDGINGEFVYGLNINYELLKHVKVIDCIVHKGDVMVDYTVKWSIDDDSFDFTSELIVPGNVISLEGKIEDTAMKLKIVFNGDVAELRGDITKGNGRGSFQLLSSSTIQALSQSSLTGGYDLQTVEKRFWLQANGDGKRAQVNLSFMLDDKKGKVELQSKVASGPLRRTWSLIADFDLTKSQRNAGVNLQIHDNVFGVKLTWVPGKYKGNMKIDITTTVSGYTSLGGELQYNLDRANTLVSSYVQWADNKRISVDLSVSVVNVIGSIIVTTPFPNTKKIEVYLVPSFDTGRKNVQLSMKYGNQKEIRLNLDWHIDRQVGELQFKVDSTFADFKRFVVKVTYDTRNNIKTQLAMSWPGENDPSKDLEATFENAGYEMLDAEINFGAFAKAFKISQIIFKYDTRSDNKFGEFLIEKGNEKVELRTSYHSGSLLHVTLHTPHSDCKTISGEITFDRKEKSATINAKWNEKHIEILAVSKLNANMGHLEVGLESNWEAIRSGKIFLKYDLKAQRPFVTAEYHCMETAIKLHFETAITLSEHYAILFPKSIIIEATLNWSNGQKIQFTVEGFFLSESSSFTINLKSPFSPCENNFLKTGHYFKDSMWAITFSSAICEEDTNIYAGLDNKLGSKWLLNSSWKSDFFAPGLVDGALELDAPGDNGWITLQWAESTIEVKGRVDLHDRKMNTRLVVRNSFMENAILIVGNYDASSLNHRCYFELDFGEGDRVVVLGEVDTEDSEVTGGNVRLMTPVKGMEDIYLKLKYINNRQTLLGDFVLAWGSSENQTFETSGLLTNKDFNFEMKTPLRILRNLHVNSTLESRKHSIEFEAKFSLNDKNLLETLVKLELNLPHLLHFTFDFYSPLTKDFSSALLFISGKNDMTAFMYVRCHKLLIHFDAQYDHQKTLNVTAQIEIGTSKFNMLANWHDGLIELTADLNSPLDPKGIFIKGKGTYTDVTGNIELNVRCSKSEHSIIADLNWQNSKFDGSATINCPFISKTQRNIKLFGKYTTDMININIEADSRHKLQIELSKGAEKKIAVLFDTSVTSLKAIESTLATFNNGFKFLGSVKTVKNTYEVTVANNKSSKTSETSVNAKFGNYHIFLSTNSVPHLFTGKFQLNSPSMQRNPLTINIQIENKLPVQIIVKLDINLKDEKVVDFTWLGQKARNVWSMKTSMVTNYLNIRNISFQTRFYVNNDFSLVMTAGRLSNYHSLSLHFIRDQSEVIITIILFENSKLEKNFTLAVVLSRQSSTCQLSITSAGGQKNFDLLLRLSTSSPGIHRFDIILETLKAGVTEIVARLAYNPTQYKFSLEYLKNYTFYSNTKPKRIFIVDHHKYYINGFLDHLETSIGGEATLSGSCTPLKIMFLIEKDNGQINCVLSAGDEKIEVKGSYQNPSIGKYDLNLYITTPYKDINWIKVIANLSKSDLRDGKLEVTSSHKNLNGILIQGLLDSSPQKPKVKVSVRTPLAVLPYLEASGSLHYSSDLSDILADLAVVTPDKDHNYHFKSKLNKHQKSGFDFLLTSVVDLNNIKYELECNCKYVEDEVFGLSLEIIFASEKILSSKFEYEDDKLAKHLTVDANIQEHGRYFAVLKLSPTVYRIDIATPYEKIRKMYAEYIYLDHKSLREYSLKITDSDDRNWYIGVGHGVGQIKAEVGTPLSYLLETHFSISNSGDKMKMSFSYHGLRHIDAEFSRKGNSYTLKMSNPLQFDAKWITNTSADGTITTLGEFTTDRNQRTTTTSMFIYQQYGQGVKFSVQAREHFFVMTTSVVRTETGHQRVLNVTFDGQPMLKLNVILENKYLYDSAEKSIVLFLWYPDKDVYLEMRQETGSKIWSSGVKMSFEHGRVFGLILNVIPNGHFNLRLQLPEETLYFQVTQRAANKKDAYHLEGYLGFLNRPDLMLDFNLRWLNSNGQINAEIALVQPKAEIRSTFNLIDNKNEVQMNFKFETKIQSKLNYTLTSRVSYNKPQKTLEIEVKNPPHLGDLKLLADVKSTKDKDMIEFRLMETDVQMRDKKLFEGILEVHNKSVQFSYIYDNGKHVMTTLTMPSFKLIVFDVSHGFQGDLVSDFNTTLTLNSSRFLIGSINWRPGAIFNAAEKFASVYFDTKDRAIEIGSKMQETLYAALRYQKIEAMEILDSIKQRVVNIWERETRDFNEDINNFAKKVKKLYDEDSFGVRTFAERIDQDYGSYLRTVCNYMLDTYSHFTYELRHGSEEIYEYFATLGRDFLSQMDRCVLSIQHGAHDFAQDPEGTVRFVHKRLSGLLMQMAAHIKEKLADPLLLRSTPHINYLIDRLGTKFQQIAITCTEHVKEFIRASKKVPAIRQLMQFASDWIPDKDTLKVLEDYYNQMLSKYTENFEKGTKIVESWTQHAAVVQLTDYASTMGEKLSWMYNYMEIEKHITSLAKTIVNRVKETFVELMQEVVSDLPEFNYHVPNVMIDADKGRIVFHQRLPFEWESFRQLPKFKIDHEVSNLKGLKDKIRNKIKDFSFTDVWNNHWSKLSFEYGFAPKFESYILVSDLVDRKFTAIVNYVNSRKKSITLQFEKTELEVSTADGNLKVDGQKTEYPLQLGPVTAVRTGDSVTIRHGRHFQVKCSIQLDICLFDIDGLYHGKIGGLFGNFDKEESNDLLMSNRERTKDIVEFVRSWQLQNCKTETNSAIINSRKGQLMPTICRDLLDDIKSPLQKCFKKITPRPFFHMCMNDVFTTSEKAAATVIATYVTECNYNGIKLKVPADCVYCSLSNSKEFTAQNAIRLSGNEEIQSTDTILLIEEKNCNREKKFAQDVVTAIENAFSEHRIQNNRYGLVGFSGDGVHDLPHIHTMNGQVFGSWQALTAQALPKLQVGHGATDLLTVLRFITGLPFRSGVRRNVVALLCNSQSSASDLEFVQNQMENHGIVVHVISNVNLKSDVIGCDTTQAYTPKAGTRIACPPQFSESVESKIALQSNGSYTMVR
uniref:Vitellogenin domain-containing protein n=1 Tax=Strigamia maritima TaxID=126957 RepID=T1J9X6_STRMM